MNKPLIELITCDSGDWSVLKMNNVVEYEGHSISDFEWVELIRNLGFKVEEKEISNEDMEMGNY